MPQLTVTPTSSLTDNVIPSLLPLAVSAVDVEGMLGGRVRLHLKCRACWVELGVLQWLAVCGLIDACS